MSESWFNVDRAGLAALIEHRGKSFAVFELIQNAWDSGAKNVSIKIEPIPGRPMAELTVKDNSTEGWANIEDAFTMFGRSRRGSDATKRGRYCMGEKLVLALCGWAKVETTGGTITFNDGGRRRSSERTESGTIFTCHIKMTRDELVEVEEAIAQLIPPANVTTTFNGQELSLRQVIRTFDVKLPTVLMDQDGNLRPTTRLTTVEAFEQITGDGVGQILEMGIPVCNADWPWRLNVHQKVPMGMERNQVTDAFRRALQVAATNAMADTLNSEQAVQPWACEAMGDSRIKPEAVQKLIVERFGERAVVAVPGDPMANATAEAGGYTVIHGGAMSADAWANVRKHNLIPSTSQAFPTPRPADRGAAPQVCPLCKQAVVS